MDVYWSYVPLKANDAQIELLNTSPICLYDIVKEEFKNSLIADPKSSFMICPAFKNLMRRTYALLSPIDMTVSIGDDGIIIKEMNQKAFDNFVYVRSHTDKIVSFDTSLVLFSEQNLMTNQLPAYMSSNEFNNKTRIIPGSFNISKWFRPLEAAFILNSFTSNIKIKKGDPLFYITFDTEEEINLKRFNYTNEMDKILNKCVSVKNFAKHMKLDFLYNLFATNNLNKQLLKAIKNNLSEV